MQAIRLGLTGAVLMLLASSTTAAESKFTWLDAVYISGAAMDVQSSVHRISEGRYELNPLYYPIRTNAPAVGVALSGSYLGIWFLAHKLEGKHPTIARVMKSVGAGSGWGNGIRNQWFLTPLPPQIKRMPLPAVIPTP